MIDNTTRQTQNEYVLEYIRQHGSITQREATRIGIMRLASRISDLKKDGYAIKRVMIQVQGRHGRTRIARYSMAE